MALCWCARLKIHLFIEQTFYIQWMFFHLISGTCHYSPVLRGKYYCRLCPRASKKADILNYCDFLKTFSSNSIITIDQDKYRNVFRSSIDFDDCDRGFVNGIRDSFSWILFWFSIMCIMVCSSHLMCNVLLNLRFTHYVNGGFWH